jgi:ABC-type branched-subunit amino acid transport system substrate-binding protein
VKQSSIRRALLLIGAVAVLALSACANNSTIIHSYIDPTANTLQLEGVLVIAITQKKAARIEFEDAFVKALRQRGANAVASHTLLPSDKPTKENVVVAAKKANLDTILVTRYLGKNDQAIYHPGTIYYGVTPTYGFGGYYGQAYEVAYQQPVYTSNVTYTLNSDLFTTNTGQHLWQALSETIKAGGTGKLRDDVIKSFVGNMKDAGLFK